MATSQSARRNVTFLLFQLCDVVLKIGVDSIQAHKVVLASVSPYFYAMFNGECIRQKPRVLTPRPECIFL
jgi:hypothetical protein